MGHLSPETGGFMKIMKRLMPIILILLCSCSRAATTGMLMAAPPEQTRSEYRIQPGDQLDIKFFYNPELNEQITVRSDGRITLQLINEVDAGGLTPAQLTENLKTAYAKEIVNPKIAVIVRVPVADKVFVDGEVVRAGLVPISGPTTAVQSIAQAGGLKESANAKTVVVIRRGEDNQITTMQVNVEQVRKGAEDQDVLLRPNDIVYVPKSGISNLNNWIDLYIRKNIPLPIGIGYSLR